MTFNLNKKNKRVIILASIVILFLIIFQKWQIRASEEYLIKGNKQYEKNNYAEALRDYKYAATVDGENNIAYLARIKRAEIFYKYKQFDSAKNELSEALKIKKDDHAAYEIMGDIFFEKKEFAYAIDQFNKASQVAKENLIKKNLSIKRTRSFIAKGDMDSAQIILENLHSENSNMENDEENYLGGLLEFYKNVSFNDYLKKAKESGNYNKEIENIENFLTEYDAGRNKDYNDTKITSLYISINEPYLAKNKIIPVIKNNEGYRDAWIVLGKTNFLIEEYKDSLNNFEKALAIDSHNEEIYFWLGSIYEKLANSAKAKENFEIYEKLK